MEIVPASMEYVDSFWAAIDEVAHERKYLRFTEAPQIESTRLFVKSILDNGWVQYYALEDDRVVGWCDILSNDFETTKHSGKVGMGVIAKCRRQGLGRRLLMVAIEKAFENGLTRIELDVHATNTAACSLYASLGFREEGRKRKAIYLDGAYKDIIVMALFADEWKG
ncbi:MAG: GNAT family N-acetyltransferase [Verrucomicrobiota bacterium]